MGNSGTLFVIDADGSVQVRDPEALKELAGEYSVVQSSSALLVLHRRAVQNDSIGALDLGDDFGSALDGLGIEEIDIQELGGTLIDEPDEPDSSAKTDDQNSEQSADGDESADSTARKVMMAGEITSRAAMLDIVSMISGTRWRGELTVIDAAGTERSVVFDQGALLYCRSTFEDERLGEILYRDGALTREQLAEVLEDLPEGKRIGQACVEAGLLNADELFEHLQNQAKQIFFATLLVRKGAYAFYTLNDEATPATHMMHIPVQGLLMEGVQRIDEIELFRERIPSTDLCPDAKSMAPPSQKLEDTARTILDLCDGTRSIDDIARLSGLGEFKTTKALYQLLQMNHVELRTATNVAGDEVVQLVESFNAVMIDVFAAVAKHDGVRHLQDTMSTWISGSGYGPFFGDELQEDGTVDAKHVADAITEAGIERPLEALHQGMQELVAFALFAATRSLPREDEEILASDVNRRLTQIRF